VASYQRALQYKKGDPEGLWDPEDLPPHLHQPDRLRRPDQEVQPVLQGQFHPARSK
jgi:hypothetical protein